MVLLILITACGREEAPLPGVSSYLEGKITVRADTDSLPDYRGFEVLVALQTDGEPDTLGYAVTDSAGLFQMDIRAEADGVYPMIVSRAGTILAVDELVVAEGDSGAVTLRFPNGNRPFVIRSRQNGAWMAYKNTKAQYNQSLMQQLRSGTYDEAAIRQYVVQASSILWSLRDTYPNTVGAELAAAEAVVMLDGWDDALLLERADALEAGNKSIVEVGRAARRAKARLAGQAEAVALVRRFQERVGNPEQKAALASEIVVAYLDSLQTEEALAAAREIKANWQDGEWATWADRALYELENLLPGMKAPGFAATTLQGQAVGLEGLQGQVVILEFYAPENPIFQRELAERNALFRTYVDAPFSVLSVSLQPDTLMTEAFLEGRDVAGQHIIARGGMKGDLAQLYNINVLPTRYLIDRNGRILGKYVGSALDALQVDLQEQFGGL